MKIIFMGSPEFAAVPLKYLINHHIEVAAVFTQRPKKQDRGMKESYSPVHNLAIEYDIPVYTPRTLKDEAAANLMESIKADIIVVVAYGFIIPSKILKLKRFGCINLHPSLLPKYRGAAPMQHTILNGDDESGVCIIQMDEGIDTGDILMHEKFTLPNHITYPELYDQCINLGAKLLLKTLNEYVSLSPIKQNEEGACYAHKFTKEHGLINWSESAELIEKKVRALNPWPGTYFYHQGKMIKILKSFANLEKHDYQPGEIINSDFHIACGSGILIPEIIKPEGRGMMTPQEFLRGIQ